MISLLKYFQVCMRNTKPSKIKMPVLGSEDSFKNSRKRNKDYTKVSQFIPHLKMKQTLSYKMFLKISNANLKRTTKTN